VDVRKSDAERVSEMGTGTKVVLIILFIGVPLIAAIAFYFIRFGGSTFRPTP
jgi:hypothetical protein